MKRSTDPYAVAADMLRHTPQSRPVPGRETEMVPNNAGGYVFPIPPLQFLHRFLVLGTSSGTYYVSRHEHTDEALQSLNALFNSDLGEDAVAMIMRVSVEGRAPKRIPTLFALACAYCSPRLPVRQAAAAALFPTVRTQSDLMTFLSYVTKMRGWGRLLRDSVGNWYLNRSVPQLAYQVTKYRNRSGWTTADVLRCAKPVPKSKEQSQVLRWAVGKLPEPDVSIEPIIQAVENIVFSHATFLDPWKMPTTLNLIKEHRLTREMLPSEWLAHPVIWNALLPHMPLTAMIRNLGKMTSIGLLDNAPGNGAVEMVIGALHNKAYLHRSRIHPFNVLVAMSIYEQGHGDKGNLTWRPVTKIVDALDSAFYDTFANVEPIDAQVMIALDVSASMTWQGLCGAESMTPRRASTALALVLQSSAPQNIVTAFANGPAGAMPYVSISPRQRLTDAIQAVEKTSSQYPFCGTDCALPMQYALANRIELDAFVILTDNETWAGDIHPTQALANYRVAMNRPNAKLIVIAMTSTGFTIADPKDKRTLDVVGFDTSVPTVLENFLRE